MLQNSLLRQLVEKAKACEGGNIEGVGELFNFLDEHGGMALYEAVCHELALREPNLTEKERTSLRAIGITFYDENDEKPIDFLVRHNDEDELLRDG